MIFVVNGCSEKTAKAGGECAITGVGGVSRRQMNVVKNESV